MHGLSFRASVCRICTLSLLVLAILAAGPAAAQLSDVPDRRSNADLVVRNVNIVDTETGAVALRRAIVIRGNVILAIVSDGAITGADRATMRVIDGGGAYAIPGLWDAHVHLMQNGSDNARMQAAAMVGHGILHARDMGESLAARDELLPLLRAPDDAAPHIISSGPTLWTFALPYGDASGQLLMTDDRGIDAGVSQLHAASVDFLKVYAGFDAKRLARLASVAKARGLMLTGHAQTGMTLAEQAQIGLRVIEHLDFSTLGECAPDSESYFDRVIAARFRNSGEAIPAIYAAFAQKVDTPACMTALQDAAVAGLVLTPTMVAGYLPADDPNAITLPVWMADGCALYRQQYAGLSPEVAQALPDAGRRMLRMVVAAGVPVLAGSDSPAFCAQAGSALITELGLLGQAGLSPLAVLQSATLLPGRLFGGAVAPGRIRVDGPADILLLATNPLTDRDAYMRPTGLYDGRVWRDAEALAALRKMNSLAFLPQAASVP
ncbi:amidohydrolase family protein [Sphingomonas sp. FW199]|uniref:amidohydrolase family protein n=1 Tax=Sphingomonas sp. FW199 TaxID=3400217 RepID=UPI003CE71109